MSTSDKTCVLENLNSATIQVDAAISVSLTFLHMVCVFKLVLTAQL